MRFSVRARRGSICVLHSSATPGEDAGSPCPRAAVGTAGSTSSDHTPDWERTSAAAVYDQIAHFVDTTAGTTHLAPNKTANSFTLCRTGQIYNPLHRPLARTPRIATTHRRRHLRCHRTTTYPSPSERFPRRTAESLTGSPMPPAPGLQPVVPSGDGVRAFVVSEGGADGSPACSPPATCPRPTAQ